MVSFYNALFGVLALITGGLLLTQASDRSTAASGSPAFRALRNNYVFVYALMMGEEGPGAHPRRSRAAPVDPRLITPAPDRSRRLAPRPLRVRPV